MANDTQDTSLLLDEASAAARTAEAREAQSALKSREVNSQSSRAYKGEVDADVDNALDSAFRESGGQIEPEIPPAGTVAKAPGVPDNPAEPPPPKTPAQIAAEAAAAAEEEGKTSLDALLKDAREEPSKSEEPEAPAAPEPPKEYAEHSLPANASQKSKDSFENLKRAAQEREAAQRTRAEAAEARAQAAEKAAQEAAAKVGVLTPELEQELKDLREHRALFSRENDPTFKQKYDAKQQQHYEAIYTRLKFHQLPDEAISELKAMSKKDRDAKIDEYIGELKKPEERRPFETQLLRIQSIEEEREQELLETKAKAAQIVKAEREAPAVHNQQKIDQIADLIRPKLNGLKWLTVVEIPKETPPEQKKALEASNKFAVDCREALKSAIVNDDPQTRATAALSVPLSIHFATQARLEKARADSLQARLDKIVKAGSTSRLSERASVNSKVAAVASDLSADPRDVMDDLFKQASGSSPRG